MSEFSDTYVVRDYLFIPGSDGFPLDIGSAEKQHRFLEHGGIPQKELNEFGVVRHIVLMDDVKKPHVLDGLEFRCWSVKNFNSQGVEVMKGGFSGCIDTRSDYLPNKCEVAWLGKGNSSVILGQNREGTDRAVYQLQKSLLHQCNDKFALRRVIVYARSDLLPDV